MDYWEQKTVKMFGIAFLVGFNLIISACQKKQQISLPYYNAADFTPYFLDAKAASKQITHQIAPFRMLNEDSMVINQQLIENKIHVANFIFTRCGSICPTMTKNMKMLSDSFAHKQDLNILSYTVTPWIDSPSVLKKYKISQQIEDKKWHFLTGSKEHIYSLARRSYFAEEDLGFTKDSTEFLHTEHVILVDKNKKIRGVYNGTLAFDIQQLIEDIKTLSKEQSSYKNE